MLLSCRLRRGGIELAVWDTGIGIAPDQQTAVFQEFLQLGKPERDRRKGFGLGLAIVAGLARRLDQTCYSRNWPACSTAARLPALSSLPAAENPYAIWSCRTNHMPPRLRLI